MSRLNLKDYRRYISKEIVKLNIGYKIDFFTFKKDRKISILRVSEKSYKIIEDGFKQREFENIDISQLEKIMEKLRKIEFPRSNTLFLEQTKF